MQVGPAAGDADARVGAEDRQVRAGEERAEALGHLGGLARKEGRAVGEHDDALGSDPSQLDRKYLINTVIPRASKIVVPLVYTLHSLTTPH